MFILAEVYREDKKEAQTKGRISRKVRLRDRKCYFCPLFYPLDIPFTHLKEKWKKN